MALSSETELSCHSVSVQGYYQFFFAQMPRKVEWWWWFLLWVECHQYALERIKWHNLETAARKTTREGIGVNGGKNMWWLHIIAPIGQCYWLMQPCHSMVHYILRGGGQFWTWPAQGCLTQVSPWREWADTAAPYCTFMTTLGQRSNV